VRVLLDTHMMLWALTDSPRLSARARAVLADAENECWVSSASVWELAIKVMLDVTIRHAAAIERVAVPHSDPFDRLLLAQCEVETLRLLTADKVLAKLPVAIAA
jgi:PIN domain nuclease of toxin-antitoxin system